MVAEGFELADVVALLAVGVGASGVEVGAEIDEVRVGIRQQVPNDDQDGADDRDDGAFLALAPDDPAVTLAEESVVRPITTAASPRVRAR
ncbi:hypothetical protein [Microtetraspora glauca]|uniref:Uncharacterized protein n=1 Tax=Microtetraspora glauca TaxID=1996 RepID=A0ABV3GHW1_MICGL